MNGDKYKQKQKKKKSKMNEITVNLKKLMTKINSTV